MVELPITAIRVIRPAQVLQLHNSVLKGVNTGAKVRIKGESPVFELNRLGELLYTNDPG